MSFGEIWIWDRVRLSHSFGGGISLRNIVIVTRCALKIKKHRLTNIDKRCIGGISQFRWYNREVEFFVRRYKNPQAVAALQARILVKYDGKGASECANRELRDVAYKYRQTSASAFAKE